jgi:NAD(P)-dependent dehydrogenase (short-subunit alcohol dehydrogenase family)
MLDGHVARITGGGTGLGRAAAAELIACGAHVVICGRREEVRRDAVQRLGERSSWVSGLGDRRRGGPRRRPGIARPRRWTGPATGLADEGGEVPAEARRDSR